MHLPRILCAGMPLRRIVPPSSRTRTRRSRAKPGMTSQNFRRWGWRGRWRGLGGWGATRSCTTSLSVSLCSLRTCSAVGRPRCGEGDHWNAGIYSLCRWAWPGWHHQPRTLKPTPPSYWTPPPQLFPLLFSLDLKHETFLFLCSLLSPCFFHHAALLLLVFQSGLAVRHFIIQSCRCLPAVLWRETQRE